MPQNGPIILRIAVPSPLRRTFDYKLPESLRLKVKNHKPLPGMRVTVEFGRRLMVGLIVDIPETSEVASDKLKDISEIIDSSPIVSQDLLSFLFGPLIIINTHWVRHYLQLFRHCFAKEMRLKKL